MFFPTRTDFSAAWDVAPALGGQSKILLTNEFHLHSLAVIVPVTVGSEDGNSVAVGAGLLEIVKRIRLTVAEGSSNRNVFDVTGSGLIEQNAILTGKLDYNTAAARNSAAGKIAGNATYYIAYPLTFAEPRLCDPSNLATLLPCPSYSAKPELSVQFATKAEITGDATPTITLGAPFIRITRCKVPTGLKFATVNFDVIERQTTFTSTGQQDIELEVPGLYTSILLRNFGSDGSRGAILAGGEARLQRLGVNIHRWTEPALALATQRDLTFTPFDGALMLDFLGNVDAGALTVDSGLDANILQQTGARIQLIQQIGVASSTQTRVMRRLLGDVSSLRRYPVSSVL